MMMPPVDAVTRDDLAYLRAHGRNAEGFVHGQSVAERFDEVMAITPEAAPQVVAPAEIPS